MRTRISPQRRLKAARLVRQGTPVAAVERETGISKRTLWRWLHDDDDFLTLVHGSGTIQVGPIRIAADHDAVQVDDLPDDSVVWIDRDAEEVIGSVHVDDAHFVRAIFARDPEGARGELAAGRIPQDVDAAVFTLRAEALSELADADNVSLLCRITSPDPVESFHAFLSVWRFKSGEEKAVRILGESLWSGQQELADIFATEPFTFLLKARKLGQSTLAVAKCGWVARVRDPNARVHLYSYRERAAKRLLEQVKYGLQNLPPFLRLPIERETQIELVYAAGADDERVIASYPMSTHTSIEETSTHSMLDEAAFWPDGENTLDRLEPTYSSGTADLVTTGNGPTNYATALWNVAKHGDALFRPVFLPATARPGRDETFLARKKRTMRASGFRSEYALSEADALAGPEEREFAQEDIDACTRYPRYGPQARTGWPLGKAQHAFPRRVRNEPKRLCRYILGVDVGKKDATVITALDVTSDTYHVAGWWRYVGLTYPALQSHITRIASAYPNAPVVIEQNGVGVVLTENLTLPHNRIIPFTTSAATKARLIEGVARKLQTWELQFDRNAIPQLYDELVSYAIPDDYLTQDAVMSLGFAVDQAPEAFSPKNMPGRVMNVFLA